MGRAWFRAPSAFFSLSFALNSAFCGWPGRLPPAVSGSGVRCGRACWARVSAVLRPSWLGCPGVFFALFFFCFVVSVAGCPCPGPCGPCPPIPFLSGWAAGSFFFFVVCVCMFQCYFSWWAAVPGLVLPVLAGWSPRASLGVPSSVPSEWGVWPPLVVLAGGLVAVGCFSAPPPSPLFFFSRGGGLPVPPSAFPGLAHALARIQCGLPGCCWRLRSVWPFPGPMGRVGYVHVWLGVPSCRLRSWLCRLGSCARRWRVALG